MAEISLIATDLDGTFLAGDKSIPPKNLDVLKMLGQHGITRVAATGRNLRKVCEVIAPEVPFDYIIFSSGAGIYDWQNRKHIFMRNISLPDSKELTKFLVDKRLNFNAFKAAPDNHYLWYHRGGGPCEEFERYFSFHNSVAAPLPLNNGLTDTLCQFLVILPNDVDFFLGLKNEVESFFPGINVIRSTSPLETGFIWMEIFSKGVSKGNALAFICRKFSISQDTTIGIGNDFNDLDLLDFTHHSFVVENSPEELKGRYNTVPTNDEGGFSFALGQLLMKK